MTRHAAVMAVLVALFTSLTFAQRSVSVGRPGDSSANIELVIHVVYPNERHAGEHITVMLESPGGGTIAQAFTNSEGKAIFANVTSGQYVIRVRDQSIKETATGVLQLMNERNHHEYVRAEPADSADGNGTTALAAAAPAAKIPDRARKEFERGNAALAAGQNQKAIEHYGKAVQLYPQFAMAYNNLAAVYLNSKDVARAREALNSAWQAEPELAFTRANLIRLALQERKYPEAIRLAEEGLAREPRNPEFLFLMCQAQAFAGNVDATLAYARKVYSGPHQGFELAHLAAGRALEAKHLYQEARAEYARLLEESPTAPETAEARKSIARLDGAAKAPAAK